ncbi:5381_t:CDS:2, partial [Diversispora eburnea]
MTRTRDVRDQIVGLCERAEVELKPNPNSGDLLPIQKVIGHLNCVSGVFHERRSNFAFWRILSKVKYGDPRRTIYVHPSSSLFQVNPKWVLFYELVLARIEPTGKRNPKPLGSFGDPETRNPKIA